MSSYVWAITVKVIDADSEETVALSTHHTMPVDYAPTDADRVVLREIEEIAWHAIYQRLSQARYRPMEPSA